jgi:hypothetical protein
MCSSLVLSPSLLEVVSCSLGGRWRSQFLPSDCGQVGAGCSIRHAPQTLFHPPDISQQAANIVRHLVGITHLERLLAGEGQVAKVGTFRINLAVPGDLHWLRHDVRCLDHFVSQLNRFWIPVWVEIWFIMLAGLEASMDAGQATI